jgi:DNA-binding NarL/FixJ family response regulator
VVRGASTKEIASAMELTEATVRTYVKRVLAKVGVRSRLQLAAWLQDHPLASEG